MAELKVPQGASGVIKTDSPPQQQDVLHLSEGSFVVANNLLHNTENKSVFNNTGETKGTYTNDTIRFKVNSNDITGLNAQINSYKPPC